MRATGIVRRLDDLGRLVIPKEIRRVLGWKEGDPLELYFDRENKAIVLKKYEVEEEEKMKEYTVEVALSAWAKVIVIAQDEEEAVAKAYDVVDLDDVYDWEIDAAEVEDDDE